MDLLTSVSGSRVSLQKAHLYLYCVWGTVQCVEEPWNCRVGVHVRYTCLAVLGPLQLALLFNRVHSDKWETPGLQTGSRAHVFAFCRGCQLPFHTKC